MLTSIIGHLQSDFIKRIVLYTYYLLMVWLIHIFIISGVAFFHFLLDHRLGVVEDWIFDRGWELLIITKISALYFFSRYIAIGVTTKKIIRQHLKEGMVLPPLEAYVLVFFSFAMIVWHGRVMSMPYSWHGVGRILISYVGVFVFYMCDIYVLSLISKRLPSSYLQKNISLVLFPTLFLLVNKIVFMYATNINAFVFFGIFFGMYFSRWNKTNWTIPSLFIVLLICPVSTLFGEDPMWSDSFSPWGFNQNISWNHYLIVGLVGGTYIFFKRHRIQDVRRYMTLKVKRLIKRNIVLKGE